MDLAQMKAAVTMEGVLSGTAALELIAEVERLISLCAEYRGEVDPLKDRITALECEVEESRALCDGYRGEVEAAKTRTAKLMDLLRDASNRLHCYSQDNKHAEVSRLIKERDTAESALTRARAEAMEEAEKIAAEMPTPGYADDSKRDGYEAAKEDIAAAVRARATKGDRDEG